MTPTMVGAFWYRYRRTLLRGGLDSAAMFVRPLVMAGLFVLFAAAASPGGNTRAFMIISLMIFNIFSNTIIGAAYEARTDASGGRLDLLVASPAGLRAYLLVQALNQLVVATLESAVVGVVFLPSLSGLHAPSAAWLAWLLTLTAITVVLAILAAWSATIRGTFVSTSFAVGLVLALAGSFYPVSDLPQWAQAIAHLNPMTYLLARVRAPLLGSVALPVGRLQLTLVGAALVALLALVGTVTRRNLDLSTVATQG